MCLVDVSDELLEKARSSIAASLQRVAKKTFADDPKVAVCGHTFFLHIYMCTVMHTAFSINANVDTES